MTIASDAGHWYDKTGEPKYTYINDKGEEKNTTLRQAREHGWIPSFSAIETVLNKHQLNVWSAKECIKLADLMPLERGEEPDEYASRVYSAFRDRGGEIMDLGSLIHGCIEKHLLGEPYDQTFKPHVDSALDALGKWCGLDGLRPEKSFGHPLGFGGKCDIHKEKPLPFVADFKTKDFTDEELPKAWGNHARQLAAYREGFGLREARCAIIFVSTAVPGLTHLVEVPEKDLTKGWDVFKCLLALWQAENNYYPSKGAENGRG